MSCGYSRKNYGYDGGSKHGTYQGNYTSPQVGQRYTQSPRNGQMYGQGSQRVTGQRFNQGMSPRAAQSMSHRAMSPRAAQRYHYDRQDQVYAQDYDYSPRGKSQYNGVPFDFNTRGKSQHNGVPYGQGRSNGRY